jgi:RNA recognition motif-containing protein
MYAACNRLEDNVYSIIQGFGYVEFANNSALQQAVDLKEPELHGRKISIMVSKPPSGGPGRGGARGRGGPGRGFGAGRGDRGRSIHQHERLAVAAAPAFVPRAIAKGEVSGKAPATTNADFRKLLNKKRI